MIGELLMSSDNNQEKRILLVYPSYSFIYEGSTIKPGAIYSPPLGLATIAGSLVSKGHSVKIDDLNKIDEKTFLADLHSFNPQYVGISFTTPLTEESFRLVKIVKEANKNIVVIAGGVHPTSMPHDVLESSEIDIICLGEGDYSIIDIVEGKPLEDIVGIAFKQNGNCYVSQRREFIKNLDDLPYPAWRLFNLQNYKTTKLLTKANPTGWIETSRGCPYGCVYCNKNVFGKNFRTKSIKRVVDEMQYMLDCGFKEIHISDDCFTVNIERAKGICEEIIWRNLRFSWATITGIRADRVDQELLILMKRAGCYRVLYGIETGNDDILKVICKGETCEDIRKAVKMSKKAGLEVYGSFMLALPGETEKTMQETINFAKELELDIAKVSITIPLPSTPYFEQLSMMGKIKEKEWSKYNFYFPARGLYDHPTLDWDIVDIYYKKFYREFYFRPRFILKRFFRSLISGQLINDIKSFIQVKW
ncbi:MAG: radical SAM protein [Elusimicrobiota bacterium]